MDVEVALSKVPGLGAQPKVLLDANYRQTVCGAHTVESTVDAKRFFCHLDRQIEAFDCNKLLV